MSFTWGNGGGNGRGSGYRCNGCGMWVGSGSIHSCAGTSWPKPAPYYPPPPPPYITIQPGISEERVRELIREALDEFRKDEVKRKQRDGLSGFGA